VVGARQIAIRLNVALSQALAIVIADPNIASTPAASIVELDLLNAPCRLGSASPNSHTGNHLTCSH